MDPRTAKMLADHTAAAESVPRPIRPLVRIKNDTGAWITTNRTLAIMLSVVLAAVLSAGYYGLVAAPAAERDLVELKTQSAERLKAEVSARQMTVDTCLAKAQEDATAEWVNACKARRERPGCALPRHIVQEQKRRESDARNVCLVSR